ncbi:MAG: type II toxin-antitoxin system Phd/YefM family antitoxin [Gemmataceae bacterium]|nr:type II toxin-antitoxin system Phd/YefM family antitoxin [Gemmataceae bacterium]
MKSVSAAKIAAQFNEYLEASREQPVLVTRKGKPVAVLLAVQNKAEAEQLAQGRLRSLRSVLEEAHEQLQQGAGIPHDQFWREVEQARHPKQQASARGKKAFRGASSDDVTTP